MTDEQYEHIISLLRALSWNVLGACILLLNILVLVVFTGCAPSPAEAAKPSTPTLNLHVVFMDPVDNLGSLAAELAGQAAARFTGETGIPVNMLSVRVIEQPEECNGVLFSNFLMGSRIVQLQCLRDYALNNISNRTDEMVYFFTPPFVDEQGTRWFAGLAKGIAQYGTCGRIFNAIKCHPVAIGNIAEKNSRGQYRIDHSLEVFEHEIGHLLGLQHRNEFKDPLIKLPWTMHEAALAACTATEICPLNHHPDDIGRIQAQFSFIKRDRIIQRKKCRRNFRKRKCVRACRSRLNFFRPNLEKLTALSSCESRPTRGRKDREKAYGKSSFLYQ